ncbi:MAG TPA: DUF1501 domain-containing protein [Chloroflexia bacterium]|nr:DUF1501 domain-containing protein [Chloroflexia bacterium]
MALSRREFLKNGIQAAALGLVAPSFLVKAAYAINSDDAAQAVPVGPGESPDGRARNILVVVQLSGGNDGLGTVIPYADANYYRLRPHLAVPRDQVLPLTDRMGLNPALRNLRNMYNDGHVAVLENVGYPNPNRSHFRAMEIWQTARPDVNEPTGWLGRMLAGDDCEDDNCQIRGLNIGNSVPRTLYTESTVLPSLTNTGNYQFRNDGRFARDRQAQLDAIHQLCGATHTPGIEEFVRLAAAEALDSADLLQRIVGPTDQDVTHQDNPFAEGLKLIAKVIAADVGARVFYISLGGFDTHAQQARTHSELLQNLDEGLSTFYQTLDTSGHAGRVLTMTFSEFGRRVAENASQGTDHGTALPMFLVGKNVKGGFYGTAPDLTHLQDGDITHQMDFRSVYSTLLRQWMNVDPSRVIEGSFPLLDFVRT